MTIGVSYPWVSERAGSRAPGLRFVDAMKLHATVARPVHGAPVFVGFGRARHAGRRSAPAAFEFTHWEQFRAWIDPQSDGFLGAAVGGFFANGGTLCTVLPVESDNDPAALIRAFARGGALEDVASVDLVCVPDAVKPFDRAASALKEIQAAAVEHCEAMGDRFAILDALPPANPSPGKRDDAHIEAVNDQSRWFKTRCAALYFPRLRVVALGAGDAQGRLVPPCGHVAGLYARSDARIGVHKAPANERLEGATELEFELNGEQHGRLNDASVNCIRSSAATGIRVWGARTLSGQSDWLYVPVSRLFLALAGWLKNQVDDLVFESHTPELWRRLHRRLSGYCLDLMDAGALASSDPESAFFVKCDSENNPPESRETGQLVANVGLAPTVPAEFVVVRITHGANGIAVNGL